jgi:molybdate transport system substrate-binding protein
MAWLPAARGVTQSPRDGPSGTSELVVSAAASLADVLEQLEPLYEKAHPGTKLTYNLGGSGTLELQIERGAPVDIFISAASQPLDTLASKDLLLPGTYANVASNSIALIVPTAVFKDRPQISDFADLAKPEVRTVAMGDPASVPAGFYAQQVLEHAGVWAQVATKAVRAADVRQVLAYVETGNADAGIVYATDARISSRVRIAATAPTDWHSRVVYVAAVLKGSHDAVAAREFLQFLLSPLAQSAFAKYGFGPPPK